MIKYLWSAAGYGLMAVPILFTRMKRYSAVQTDASEASKLKAREDAVADRTESVYSHLISVVLLRFELIFFPSTPYSVYLEPEVVTFTGRCGWSMDVRVQGPLGARRSYNKAVYPHFNLTQHPEDT